MDDEELEDMITDTTENIVDLISVNMPGQSHNVQKFIEKIEEARPGITKFLKTSAMICE